MPGIAFVDDQYVPVEEARISVHDLGLIYSDCVYDVTSVWNGFFFMLDAHIDRFERSCALFRLPAPYDRDELRTILATCVSRAGLDDAYVKMTLTRGVMPMQSRDFREARSALHAFATPYVWIWGERAREEGGNVHVCRRIERVSSRAIDQTVKNYARSDLAQAKLDGYEAGCDDAVLLGPDGLVTEGSGWNVLLVDDGCVSTPDHNVLEGVTAVAVGELCADLDIPFVRRPVSPEELLAADEVFAATTAGGVLPIVALDGRPVGSGRPGPLTTRVRDEYWSRRAAGWHGTKVEPIVAAVSARA